MPFLGESIIEGSVDQWLKVVGDYVDDGEPLVTVSTDKVVTDLPSPVSGVLREVRVSQDETVPIDSVLGFVAPEM